MKMLQFPIPREKALELLAAMPDVSGDKELWARVNSDYIFTTLLQEFQKLLVLNRFKGGPGTEATVKGLMLGCMQLGYALAMDEAEAKGLDKLFES